jgi:xylulokinase
MAPSGNDDVGHVSIFRDEHPDVYAEAAAFVEPMDYVAARLTGHVTATQNTMFPMLSVDNRTWGATEYSSDLLALSDLDVRKLPPLVALGAPRGRVTSEAARHLGVSTHAIVTGATIDSVTSALGTGALDSTGCGVIIGTTTVIVTHVPSKRQDLAHGLSTAPSPVPQQYFLVAENGFGGKSLDAFVNNIVYPHDELGTPAPEDAYQRVLGVAGDAARGSNGVMFMPWFAGSMAPAFQRRMRAGFVNMTLGSTRAHMARAVLEGVAFNAAWLLPFVSALADHEHPEVSFGGGGARSPLWGQILADCFGIPVCRLSNSSTTNAHGAALLALVENEIVALGDVPAMLTIEQRHEPDPAAVEAYRRLLAAYIDFHDQAAPFYDALNAPERQNQ